MESIGSAMRSGGNFMQDIADKALDYWQQQIQHSNFEDYTGSARNAYDSGLAKFAPRGSEIIRYAITSPWIEGGFTRRAGANEDGSLTTADLRKGKLLKSSLLTGMNWDGNGDGNYDLTNTDSGAKFKVAAKIFPAISSRTMQPSQQEESSTLLHVHRQGQIHQLER